MTTPEIPAAQVRALLPDWLQASLVRILEERGGPLYLAGGVVRDLVRGILPADIDLTVAAGARDWAARLAVLSEGTPVPLGRQEDAARVVSRGWTIDFSSFRDGARTIAEDLACRDLTINALACPLDALLRRPPAADAGLPIIDPTGGLRDLEQGVIRVASATSFASDPLRLLRVFRFAATLGCAIEDKTLALVGEQGALVARVAPERVAHELDLLMATPAAPALVATMAECGLLFVLLPELAAGVGLEQPKSHHLDVFAHSLEALHRMAAILAAPAAYFPRDAEAFAHYLSPATRRLRLQWAALLHDLGKPVTHAVRADKGDRITFYNHDLAGARLFEAVALRLRWSNEARGEVSRLIAGHMRPFHLANEARAGAMTLRAGLRLLRAAGEDLEGLFLLAMADSLAGQGPERVMDMEQELATLYGQLRRLRSERLLPVRSAPPLVTGHDLIQTLRLAPGPLFKRILLAIEEAQVEGVVHDRDGALELARTLAGSTGTDPRPPR